MNLLEVIDLNNGQIQICFYVGSKKFGSSAPHFFSNPFEKKDMEQIRWYLEDYLQTPYETWRATQTEALMIERGDNLFNQVFSKLGSDSSPYILYKEALKKGTENLRISIISNNPNFLNIPWELIRDPTPAINYLSLSTNGLFRSCADFKSFPLKKRKTDIPLKILLVVARPYGKKDIGFRSIAHPIIESLENFDDNVSIELLRPPTFDSFVETLNNKKNYYDIVHFDGHGIFISDISTPSKQNLKDGGFLVFERDDGSQHLVNSKKLGQTLASSGIKVFVVNACESAKEGINPFSSVALQLIATGAKAVLAMSYLVYDVTVIKFMQRFYKMIIQHNSISESVKAGRLALYSEPPRDSLYGTINLQDWMIPTLYQQDSSFIPFPEQRGKKRSYALNSTIFDTVNEKCPQGRFGLIGRDFEILRIERALFNKNNPWILITGMGGIGKTELAFGFARWYVKTGGCKEVFPITFRQKADFGQIIRSVFRNRTEIIDFSDKRLLRELINHLKKNPCLLIWDNFENVAGYPKGNRPFASESDKEKMSKLMKALRGGRSRVVIVTRKNEENWLGINYNLVEISGLRNIDSSLLAKSILRNVGVKVERFKSDSSYMDLLKLLKGHPRSMEVVLPKLRKVAPAEIVDSLRNRMQSHGENIEDATLTFTFSKLKLRTKSHLPLIGLFSSRVNLNTLINFVGNKQEFGKKYKKIMGSNINARKWKSVLREAADNGLISGITDEIYDLHPTFIPFLRKKLSLNIGEDNFKKLESLFLEFYSNFAIQLRNHLQEGNLQIIDIVQIEEENFIRALRIGMSFEKWEEVIDIFHLLNGFYNHTGRLPEWRYLISNFLNSIKLRFPNNNGYWQNKIWLYLFGTETQNAINRHELLTAKRNLEHILEYLLTLDDKSYGVEIDIAVGYFDLANVYDELGDYENANKFYKKALKINKKHQVMQHIGACYHQLGISEQHHYHISEARKYFEKSLKISRKMNWPSREADALHHLGLLAISQEAYPEAKKFILQAQEIRKNLKLKERSAKSYSTLSIIYRKENLLDIAEKYERLAINIFASLDMQKEIAEAYRSFGLIAQARGKIPEARQWFLKALSKFKSSNNAYLSPNNIVFTQNDLFVLELEEGNLVDAENWLQQNIIICKQKNNENSYLFAVILSNYGTIYSRKNKLDEAIRNWINAFRIAVNYEMPLKNAILMNLKWALESFEINEFKRICKEIFENDEILEDIKKLFSIQDK